MYGVTGSCSASLKSVIKAGNRVRIESPSGRTFCLPAPRARQSLANDMSNLPDATVSLERWRFLKQLPDRIVRDIGFVISNPPILEDSQELPTVCPDVLGGGIKTWLDSANWLANLEVDHVKQWFGEKCNNGRLGEHFAFCVEYVLVFSPFAQTRNLMTYTQVTSRTGEVGKEKHATITIQVEKDGVFIKSERGKTLEMGSSETTVSNPVDPTEDMMVACDHLQELMTHCEDEACEPENLEGEAPCVIDEPREKKSKKIGKRKRKLLRKMQRLKDGHGVNVTIGEFDFLFEEAFEWDNICSQAHREVRVNHWEVSVKFLLYAGPWEVFGFETPDHAAWRGSSEECREEEVECEGDMDLLYTDGLKKSRWHEITFLGWFLGPHVGETLYNRKTRLINQLALSQNIHAASLLCKSFGLRPEGKAITFSSTDVGENLQTTSGRCIDEAIESQPSEVLRVHPRAFLKGYLFYEYELWYRLYPNERSGQQRNHYLELLNRRMKNDGDLSYQAKVNPEHWMGWWTRACDFANFARRPLHEHSKWYIVPKLEWLSPVVIDGEDERRGQQVLSFEEFLIVAERVAEEAERTNVSRKRRFMVAEVLWEPVSALDCNALRGECDEYVSSAGPGRWSEVSRGFVVEDTWPDSRLYRPHGYRLSLLP